MSDPIVTGSAPDRGMVQVISPDGEETAWVFDDEVGKFARDGWRPVGDTNIVSDQGATLSLPAEELASRARLNEPEMVRPFAADQEDARAAILQQEYGDGVGNTLLAGGLGAARGLTFGGTDLALGALGYEDEVRNYKDANQTASFVGEGGAIVAASLLSGGTFGAASGTVKAGTGAARMGKLGAFLSKTPAGMVSARTARLGESIGGLRGVMAAEALEGAAYGTGQAISSLALSNEPLTAEAVGGELFRNGAFGALAGGVIGGGFHLGGKAVGKVKDAYAKRTQSLFDPASEEGKQFVGGLAQSIDDLDRRVAESMTGVRGIQATRDSKFKFNQERQRLLRDAEEVQGLGASYIAEANKRLTEMGGLGKAVRKGKEAEAAFHPDVLRNHYAVLRNEGDFLSDLMAHSGQKFGTEVSVLREARKRFRSAMESGETAAIRKQLTEYETALRDIGSKVGVDVEQRLAGAGSPMRQITEAQDRIAGAKALHETVKRAQALRKEYKIEWLSKLDKLDRKSINKFVQTSKEYAATVKELGEAMGVKGKTVLPDFVEGVEHRLPALLEQYGKVGRMKKIPDSIDTKGLAGARKSLRESMGVDNIRNIDSDALGSLLNKDPQEFMRAMGALDEYYKQAQRVAKQTGQPDLLKDIKGSLDGIANSLSTQANAKAAKKIGWTDLSAFAGLEMVVPDMEGPIDDLAKFVVARKMAQGAKGSSKLSKLAGGVFGTAGARGGAHVGYKAGGGGLKGAVAAGLMAKGGGRLFGGLGDRISGAQQLSGLSQKVTGQIASAVDALLRGTGTALGQGSVASYAILNNYGGGEGKDLNEAFQRHSEQIRAIAADPDSAQLVIHEALEPVRQTNETVGDQAEMQLMRIAEFLADKMPKDPGNQEFLGKSRWKPDDAALRRYARYVEAVADPTVALRGVADGTITPQAAEALKTVYPETFAEVQRQLMGRLPEIHEKLDYDKRVRLSVLFDAPVDSTMRPHFRGFVQQQFAQHGAQQAKQAQGMASTPNQNSESEMTSSQKLLAR